MPVTKRVIDELQRTGYAVITADNPRQLMMKIAVELGTPVVPPGKSMFQTLTVKPVQDANPNTYSGRFGEGTFPFHTDMANWTTPPRYLMLRHLTGDNSIPTLLLDHRLILKHIPSIDFERGIWVGRAKKRSFICNALASKKGQPIFRWDKAALRPLTPVARRVNETFDRVVEGLPDGSRIVASYASPQTVVIIDNWRMLHSRPAVPSNARSRTLERLLVKERMT